MITAKIISNPNISPVEILFSTGEILIIDDCITQSSSQQCDQNSINLLYDVFNTIKNGTPFNGFRINGINN